MSKTFTIHFSSTHEFEVEEVLKQDYDDCSISAGLVINDEIETIYLKLSRLDDEISIVLTDDEALAIIWTLSGALWSKNISDKIDAKILDKK